MSDVKNHWEKVYDSKLPTELSWYQPHLKLSLNLIEKALTNKTAQMIDVGGGTSTLVDDLLALGYENITVLDVSSAALKASQKRLGPLAQKVHWLEGDITKMSLPQDSFDLWHDRAVFHFLTKYEDRKKYLDLLRRTVENEGHVMITTFDQDGGPLRCSGLDVMRYNAETLQAELGPGFQLIEFFKEEHHTPFRTMQKFLYCRFIKSKKLLQ